MSHSRGKRVFPRAESGQLRGMLQFKHNDASEPTVSFGDVALVVRTGAFPVEQWDVLLKELGFRRSKDSERRQLFGEVL